MKSKRSVQRSFLKWTTAVLMALLLTQSGAVLPLPGSGLQMVHADAEVSSWADLRNAIAGGGTITLSGDFAYDGSSIVIPSGAKITITGDATIFSSELSSEQKYDSMFKVESGGSLTIDSGVTLSAKIIGDGGQTCPDGSTYTSDKFTGSADGKTYKPKGFFIHVDEGGSATLNGTVSDFFTSRNKATTPRYVAPVVANGNSAQFHLGPGGVIKNNVVGYIVDDNQAYEDAQTIKQYVKGAGPNVPRVPNAETQKQDPAKYANRARQKDAKIDGGAAGSGITATAGAVIYKGGATGTIKGKITNNRGDTGGIMVSGEGTVVTISGATLSKNVGVQFGGGSTVEQGGKIAMSDGEMTENVAWFGGGAVYATQNGVDWLLGRMVDANGAPLFDSRVDGVFEMSGGSLNKNTAFTRGGAILADSNGVHITKGNLQENMSRMLGGAVYVMGDHPQYTYTMYLNLVRIHDNTAVSGQYGRSHWPQNRPENQDIPDVPASWNLAEKNNLLQTKLKAPSACGGETESIFEGTDNLIQKNTDDMNDGRATDGTGGGVWLCAYGNTTFDAGSPNRVFIDNNYATGTLGTASRYDSASVKASFEANQKVSTDSRSGRSGGSDFHSDTGDVGRVTIKNANSDHSAWKNENTGASFTEDEFTSSEILNLVSTKKALSAPYNVDVSGNIARRGGGLAADGTFFLGVVEDRVTADAQMQVAKKWAFTADKSPIAIRVEATDNNGKKAVVADVPLDGVANPPLTEFDTTEELEPTTSDNGTAIWNGKINLPLQLETSDGKIDVFKFTVNNSYVDGPSSEGVTSNNVTPTTAEGSSNLAKVLTKIRNEHLVGGEPDNAAINAEIKEAITVEYNNGLKFSCKELEVEYDNTVGAYVVKTNESGNPIEKTDEDGSPKNGGKYVLSWANADLSKVSFELNTTVEKATNSEGDEIDLYSIHMLGMSLVLEAANDNEAITEKYVNKDVHADIIEFDKEFTYDIMAYVPIDATEFTISDPLVNGLEFADASGKQTTDAQEAIQQIAIHTVNNHETGSSGTVSSPVSENLRIKKDTVNAKIEGNTLSITVDKNSRTSATGASETNALKAAQGKWVQLSFNARIKDEYRNIDALKALLSETTKPSEETKSWEEKNSNKRGNPTRVYTSGNGDLALVASLISEVGPDEIIWAVEGPERLFAKTASGKYYATPASDNKAGDTWDVCAEGTPDWTNADNRYNGRPPQAYNTIGTIDLANAKLNALKNLPAVKRETVEEACEGPSRLFAKTSGGDYYATPMNDKSGLVWVKLEKDSEDWNNANNRFNRTGYESRNTIRFFDLDPAHNALTLDPEKMTNWPVISDEKHEGMANQASYTVKTANRADASYKTNTVTVAPETTKLDVEKVWAPDNTWPEDVKNVILNIYSKKGTEEKQVYVDGQGKVIGSFATKAEAETANENAKALTVTLTKDDPATTDKNESKATVKDLPKLKGTYYIAREVKITTTSSEGESVKDITYNSDKSVGVAKQAAAGKDVSVSMSSKLNDAKFQGIAENKPIRGYEVTSGDDKGRLFAITLGGAYWTKGPGEEAEWVNLIKPVGNAEETEKVKLYYQAEEIFRANGEDVFDLTEVYTATNSTAAAEKYVNNKVHAELVYFDKEFEYEVLAYVPKGATQAKISDTLVADLEFVGDTGEAKVVILADETGAVNNDHTVDGSVKNGPFKEFENGSPKITISEDKQTITAEITEGHGIDQVNDGRWVKLTFNARVKEESYETLRKKLAEEALEPGETPVRWSEKNDNKTNGAVPSDTGLDKVQLANWPVLGGDKEHEGIDNKAKFLVSFDNSSWSDYDTNTVTVKPETTKVYVRKKLEDAEGHDVTTWPDGLKVTVNVCKKVEGSEAEPEVVETITIKDFDIHESKELKRLTGVTYTVDEVDIAGDYYMKEITDPREKDDPFVITNSEKKYVDVEVTKKWKNVMLDEIPGVEVFKKFLVLKNGDEDVTETYAANLTVTANGTTYIARWNKLPDGAYTVEEKEMSGFETEVSEDGKTITNTKKPEEEKPEIEKFVNEAVHKEIDLTEEFTYDIVAYVTKDADYVKITDTLDDMLAFATDASGVSVVDLADGWSNNNHKVTNSIENVKVNEDAVVALGGTPIKDAKVEIDGKTLTVTIENKLKPVYEDGEENKTSEESGPKEDEQTNGENKNGTNNETGNGTEGKAEDASQNGTTPETAGETNNTNGGGTAEDGSNGSGSEPAGGAGGGEGSEAGGSNTKEGNSNGTNEAGGNETNGAGGSDTNEGSGGKANEAGNSETNEAGGNETNEAGGNEAGGTGKEQSNGTNGEPGGAPTGQSGNDSAGSTGNEGTNGTTNETNSLPVSVEGSLARILLTEEKPGAVSADAGTADKKIIGYEYDGEEQPVKALRGHWIKITFKAKIEKDKALEEIAKAYQTIRADEEEKDRAKENVGNAPVVSAEDHRGIPNKTGYTIGVANEAGIQYDTYKDESNTVTVKPKEEFVEVAVVKKWEHGNNEDLPDSVTIRLLADDVEIDTLKLNESNQWEGSFSGLAKYKDQETRKNRITYTITEDAVEGYTSAVTGTAEDGFTVTNTFVEEEKETTSLKVIKDWNDLSNEDGRRPKTVTFRLLANGEPTGESMTLSSADAEFADRWIGSFTDLPAADENGEMITYSVAEEAVPYYRTIIQEENGTVRAVNLHRPWFEEVQGDSGNEGQFTVEKAVGEGVSRTRTYDIKVTMTMESGAVYSKTIRLKPGDEPYLFDYVKFGTKVAIEEVTTGFKATYTVNNKETQEFTLQTGDDVRVVVLNEKKEVTPAVKPDKSSGKTTPAASPVKKEAAKTGDAGNSMLWISLMAIAVFALAGLRRKAGK